MPCSACPPWRAKTFGVRSLDAIPFSVPWFAIAIGRRVDSVLNDENPLWAIFVCLRSVRSLRVRNFTQQGGVDRGVVTVTLNDQSANVLTASRIDTSSLSTSQETLNQVVIAGPAEVTIAPVVGATLFITYRKEANEGRGSLPADVTPTPTVTPAATATPTATP